MNIKFFFNRIHFCFFGIIVLVLLPEHIFCQNCDILTQINGRKIIACPNDCTGVTFTIPNIQTPNDYRVSSIPYKPFAYTTPNHFTDIEDTRTGRFGNIHTFFFPFCFYDSTYNSFVLSPSGLLTFESGIAQCTNNPGAPFQIPYALPSCDFAWYYPKASIFGCYAVLDPSRDTLNNYFGSPPERKIEWREEGTAPCRRLIVSYYHIGSLFAQSCSFTTPATFQMVMYESTGLIDVYIENYTCINTFDNGNAVLGIQNWARNKGIAAPGKNATVWTAREEAWRFTPSGGNSRFGSCRLFTLNGSFVADADTAVDTADSSLLKVSFNNICPAADTTKYIVQTSYIACPTGNTITSYDTITVIKRQLDPVITNNNGTLQTGSFTTYQWLLDGNPVPNASGQTLTATQSGYYQVAVTDSAGCKDTSQAYNYNIVPVTLSGFSAHFDGVHANILNWQTAQETNSSHFTVQRTYNLPHFNDIGEVPAAGSSSTIRYYKYTDSNILYQPTFYRLQQADRDGQYRYSKTIMLHPVKNGFSIGRLYPNPSREILTIEFNSHSLLPVEITVMDILGRNLQKTIVPAVFGFNKTSINTGSLAKGRYVLRLLNEYGCIQMGFVKY